MLEAQSLSRNYRGIPAIEEVSFKVGAGEIVGYLGANGSGKSTTVKIITGMLRPNLGRVLFRGRDIRNDLQGFRASLGYIPEEAHLYAYMSAMEYLQLVGRLRGMSERTIQEKAQSMLRLLGIESWKDSPMSLYSKGMRQRVLMAAALLHNPSLLVLDEPLSGLDILSARLFKDLLRELAANGKAILYISHVLEIVEQLCSRVLVLSKGRIVADAPPAELLRKMQMGNLENAFYQLAQEQDTSSLARELVSVMQVRDV